jgi:RNA polymerase sigma-70 factor (ECF subfamily)
MLDSDADAEDVLQETWLRAVARLGAFEWRSGLGTWLASIAINTARDVLDRHGRWLSVELEEEMLGSEPHGGMEQLDLERALVRLPAGCRAVFVLHDVEGFTHEEIAAQFGYTAGTSKSQLFRARRALRKMLEGSSQGVPASPKEERHAKHG